MAINHKIDYKSYCKYSLLYEAVMGRTKDFNEVTKKVSKVSFSLFMLLESSEKTLQAMWAAARLPSPMSSMVLLWRPGLLNSPHKMTDSFAGLTRPTTSRQPPNSPKSGVVLWGEKSLLQPPLVISGRWASVAANLQQNPCLTASRS